MRPASVAAVMLPLALGLLVLFLAQPAEAAFVQELHVHVSGVTFEPKNGELFTGGTVTWHGHDAQGLHTITFEDGSYDEDLNGPISITRTMSASGTFAYYCKNHGAPGGVGQSGTLAVDLPPVATFDTVPASGYGSLSVSGTASDPDGDLSRVELRLDGVLQTVSGTSQWSATVDLGDQHNLLRTLEVTAVDSFGLTDKETRSLRVNKAPTASIAFSPSDPTSSDTLTFNGSADDDHTIKAWSWNFDGGSPTSAKDTTFRFAKGTHTVNLTVTDDHDVVSPTVKRTVTVRNSPPVAAFDVFPLDPAINEPTTFNDLTSDIDNDAVNWTWDFGDGAKAFVRNATHVYTSVGTYTVRFTVKDAEGAAHNVTKVVEVKEFATARPVARLVAAPERGVAPLTVTFTLGGFDPDGTVANWSLDFGDGPLTVGPGSLMANNATFDVSHTYRRNGTYTAVLTVLDNLGVGGTNRTTVTVDLPPNRPPTARFEVVPTASPRKGQPVHFADASSDADFEDRPAQWAWSFGDGALQCCLRSNVTHSYARVGSYLATLTVTDTRNGTASAQLRIEVRGDTPAVALKVNDTSGRAPFPAAFTPAASDRDGRIVSWSLNYGDGSPVLRGEGPPPNTTQHHVYDREGTFTALLEVVDDDGLVGSSALTLTVGVRLPDPVPLPTSALSVTPTGQRLTYRFVATTTLSGDLTYQWAFGDGRTASGRDVVYSYAEAGSYAVALTILGEDGPIARGGITLPVVEEGLVGQQRVRSEVANGIVRVVWTGDARADGYQVWKQVGTGRFEELRVVRGATHFDDFEVEDGTAYAYQVTFFEADGSGRLQRLSQLNSTEAYRRLGVVRVTGLVDSDGDGVGDTRDAYPQDAGRAVAPPNLVAPLLLVGLAAAGGVGAWRYLGPSAARRPKPLTAVPGLAPEYATVLASAGVPDVATLAAASAADLARRTVVPLPILELWIPTAQLMLLPGLAPAEAGALVRSGIRGTAALARANPLFIAERTGATPARAERWVRTARTALEAA